MPHEHYLKSKQPHQQETRKPFPSDFKLNGRDETEDKKKVKENRKKKH